MKATFTPTLRKIGSLAAALKKNLKGLMIAAVAVVNLALAGSANAIVFDLTSDHCTGSCGPAPFGTVDVTQDGTTVNFTVDLAGANSWAKTGAADFQLFKFNGTGVALGDISVTQTFAGQTLAAQTGAFNGRRDREFPVRDHLYHLRQRESCHHQQSCILGGQRDDCRSDRCE